MKDLEELTSRSPLPQKSKGVSVEIDKTGLLGSERNRLYSFCFVLLIAVLILAFQVVSMADNAANNHKVAWVKMYANGTWDVVLHENQGPQQFLQQTVDSLLSNWVKRRFSKIPETIRNDYGYATLLMSERKKGEFVDQEGFNAAQIAANVLACRGCDVMRYNVGPIDHFDIDEDLLSGVSSTVYRTNVFADKQVISASGQVKDSDKRIVRIQWRLMDAEEVQRMSRRDGGLEWLRQNPIGIEIVEYEELNDPSDK